MMTKSDWNAVHEQLLADDRRRLGDPPDAGTVLAYSRGELPEAQEERVRELIVCYPELAYALSVPFPTEGAEPGDPDYLSDAEFKAHWAAMNRRREQPKGGGSIVPFWRGVAAFAMAATVLMGAFLWRTQLRLTEPRAASETYILFPDGRRGPNGESAVFTPKGESVLFVAPLINEPRYDDYRIEIVDSVVKPPRKLWASPTLARRDDDTFAVLVPRSFLRPGRYSVELYGVAGDHEERLATYSIRVAN